MRLINANCLRGYYLSYVTPPSHKSNQEDYNGISKNELTAQVLSVTENNVTYLLKFLQHGLVRHSQWPTLPGSESDCPYSEY